MSEDKELKSYGEYNENSITLFRMLINTANTSPEPISEHTPRFQQPQILPVAGGQKDVLERLWALTVTLTKKARFARILGLL